jgi:DNA invertase Pin-like site-specific DNA recombinase
MKKAALYVRCSTDEQTVLNQQRELEVVAERHGWEIVEVFADEGISGRHGREKRPGLDQLLQGVTRRDFDVVAAWSVDRLGRSLRNLLEFLEELKAKEVDLYLHQQGLDTQTPAGKAMFAMCGVFAEFERAILVERVKAGLARARAQGIRLGRPTVPVDRMKATRLLATGLSLRAVAKEMRLAPSTLSSALRKSSQLAAAR